MQIITVHHLSFAPRTLAASGLAMAPDRASESNVSIFHVCLHTYERVLEGMTEL